MKTLVPLLWAISFLSFSCPSYGQGETWSLRRCIRYAKSHNIQIQQQELQAQNAQIVFRQSRLSQLPRLSGSASLGKNFGRSIDPTTNQFVSNNLTSSGIGINAQVTLFSFFKLRNTIDAAQLAYRANNVIIKKMVHDLSLNITDAYLQILLAGEQVKISKKQVHLTKNQLKETRQKVMAGVLSVGEKAQLQAQLAKDSANLIQNQSELKETILQIKSLLNLDLATPFLPEESNFKQSALSDPLAISPEEIYRQALHLQPIILADSLQIVSSQKTLTATKAGLYPSLSLGIQVGTNYSSTFQRPIGTKEEVIPEAPIGTVTLNGNNYIVRSLPDKVNQTIYDIPPVGTQFKDNLRENVGLSLNIPLFNGLQTRTQIQTARIEVKRQRLQLKQDRMTLKQDIVRTYTQAIAAHKSYEAAQKTLQATEQSFYYAQKRYEVGHINATEYLTAQNELFTAKMDLSGKRYSYIFKRKVLAFYQRVDLSMEQ